MPHFALTGKLHPTPPFDFAKSLRYLRIFAPGRAEYFCGTDQLVKPLYFSSQAILARLKSWGSIDRPLLSYVLVSEHPISESVKYQALQHLSFSLSLYDDLREFYRKAISDALFYPIVKQLYGYHQVKHFTPFEHVCWEIFSAESRAKAWQVRQSLLRSYGTPVAANAVRFQTFPSPERLAGQSLSQLTIALGECSSAEMLRDVAVAFAELPEEFLQTASYTEVLSWLEQLPQMTPALARSVLLQSTGRLENIVPDYFDLHSTASRCYADVSQHQFINIVNRYGEWQNYWAHYLAIAC